MNEIDKLLPIERQHVQRLSRRSRCRAWLAIYEGKLAEVLTRPQHLELDAGLPIAPGNLHRSFFNNVERGGIRCTFSDDHGSRSKSSFTQPICESFQIIRREAGEGRNAGKDLGRSHVASLAKVESRSESRNHRRMQATVGRLGGVLQSPKSRVRPCRTCRPSAPCLPFWKRLVGVSLT